MRQVLLILVILFKSLAVHAEVEGQDVDDILTNAKLRAESGSKSRWSVAVQANYSGGSLTQAFGASRPNIGAVTGTTPFSDFDATVNVKYNLDSRDSLLLGGGLRWVTPFQGLRAPENYAIKKFDAFDPQLNWQRIYKLFGAQSYFQFGPTFFTRSDMVAEGYLFNLGVYNVNAWEIGSTGLTLGIENGVSFGFFKNPVTATVDRSVEEVKADQSDYNFTFNPYAEYKINDTFNLRAAWVFLTFEHTRANDLETWHRDLMTLNLGVGVSVTRDIFVFPNVLMVPSDLRVDNTNAGILADINVF